MSRITFTLGLLVVAAALSACSTVEPASPAADARAKAFEVPAEKANLYVVQTGGWFPERELVQTFVNTQPLGALAGRTYHVTAVLPGNYVVIGMSRENQQSVNISAEAGKNYFIGMAATMGAMSNRVSTYRLTDEDGRKAVRDATLAKGFTSAE